MTHPIFNGGSRSDTSQFYSDPSACDPAAQSCKNAPTAGARASEGEAPHVITLQPVYVEGDAGARSLVERHCAEQWKNAALACGAALGTAAGAVGTAAVPPLFVASLVGTVSAGATCGESLAALDACDE